MRWLRIGLTVFLAVLLLSGTALAVAYAYKAIFGSSVTVVTATPGLSVAPTQLVWGELAIGEWSVPKIITVKNIGVDTLTTLRVETNAPEGLGVYLEFPPLMPLAPGQQILVPIKLMALPGFAPGDYSFQSTVIGER